MKKRLFALLAAGMVGLSVPFTVSASWKQDSQQNWSWVENGKKATGWKKINGKWYHFEPYGVMDTYWIVLDDKTYYLGEDGAMRTGWVKDYDDKWNYYNPAGDQVVGQWKKIDGKWYYFDDIGKMTTGWRKFADGSDYYFYPDGHMATNTTIDGNPIGADGRADISAWIGNVDLDIYDVGRYEDGTHYFSADITNLSKKTIKKIEIDVYHYDQIGKPAYDYTTRSNCYTLEEEVSIAPGETFFDYWDYDFTNFSTYCFFPAYLRVTYADGSKETLKKTTYTTFYGYEGKDPKDEYFPDFPYTS